MEQTSKREVKYDTVAVTQTVYVCDTIREREIITITQTDSGEEKSRTTQKELYRITDRTKEQNNYAEHLQNSQKEERIEPKTEEKDKKQHPIKIFLYGVGTGIGLLGLFLVIKRIRKVLL